MLNQTLDRLSSIFKAEDIMTKLKEIKRADNIENAKNLFNEFDVIPYPRNGQIEGYFHHKTKKDHAIKTDFLISHGTSIINLIQILKHKKFCFVLSGNEIVGYIHFSDINKPLTKIPLYVLIESIERKLWQEIRIRINENDLKNIFSDNDFKRFIKKNNYNIKRNIDIGWSGIFTFPYILKLARHYGKVDLSDSEITLLKEVRNKIAHSDKNLVNSFKEIDKLCKAIELCLSIGVRDISL